MSTLHRPWLLLAALLGLTAVGLAAWAAHGAPAVLDEVHLGMLERGLQMQGWHALALFGTALWAERRPGLLPQLAATAFGLGAILFCGAVYSHALRDVSLGRVAPIGGMLLMAGWALLGASALVRR
ncbi:DUF423 domain-containing protein [Siccirubricoccus sp. KC 17139]|uniref:DUF423 domain-containing protein n=1 Tax=Siccirubricoccus soli TaxID=2899147 RepID=A0ABT1DBV6_9PROT|nr:DUF423 domain-containing protein [Siccirubricoccus soli]MCO6418440.1 DUF423 domain-containing protein [Siccirubricoccus soli]MCP2684575.1 DUF423 domain-containing protein [Siccirubricoccus soli]